MFIHNDGGRADTKFTGRTNDCVVRAIAIVSGIQYQQVYDELFERSKMLGESGRCRVARHLAKGNTSPRNGTHAKVYNKYLEELGFVWTATMQIGSGCKVHVRADELPATGRHVLRLSKHISAWVDGQLHDTFDCSRQGTRCVYGYWSKPHGV